MVKILMWDVSGFWLAQKRLESGRFAVRGKIKDRDAKGSWPLSVAEVMAILEGIDIRNAAYHQHYAAPPLCSTRRTEMTSHGEEYNADHER
jgi:hypothetical protein